MDAQALQLAFRRSPFVRHFFFYPEIGSTNDRARELASLGADEGTLVIAEAQSAGRGRGDRVWHSPPGKGIYVSMLFRPRVSPEAGFGVLAAVSLGAAAAVETLAPGTGIAVKWPNDLFVGSRKLGGLLSEIGTSGGLLDWVVVGLGLNVNQAEGDFPEELRERATSVRLEEGCEIDRVRLLTLLVDRTAALYAAFREGGMEAVLPEWRRRSSVLGRQVRVETAGETYLGTAAAVEDNGALRVRLEGGAEEVVHVGDVQLVQFR